MKTLKTNSPPEIKLQELEELMRELNISISTSPYHGIVVRVGDTEYNIYDVDSRDYSEELPRRFDHERMVVNE